MKYRYCLNKDNQLLIKPPKTKKLLKLNGKFGLDKQNQLIWRLNEPASWRREYNLPNKITFKGRWQLNPNYDLELVLDETKEQFKGDKLALQGEIISIDNDALAFAIKGMDRRGQTHIQLLKLSGSWQADEYNRISFMVEKKNSSPDVLTFKNAWQINKNQQIIYAYEKTSLKIKTKTSHALAFKGFWEINRSNRLTYILSRSSESRFDFRAQIESPNLYPKEGVIKYRLGIGLKDSRLYRTKIISLYGTWKFSRKTSLIFEMEYTKGEIHTLEFGAEINFKENNRVAFNLRNEKGQKLGASVIFTHRFIRRLDSAFFLRLKQFVRERGIEAGLKIPF